MASAASLYCCERHALSMLPHSYVHALHGMSFLCRRLCPRLVSYEVQHAAGVGRLTLRHAVHAGCATALDAARCRRMRRSTWAWT